MNLSEAIGKILSQEEVEGLDKAFEWWKELKPEEQQKIIDKLYKKYTKQEPEKPFSYGGKSFKWFMEDLSVTKSKYYIYLVWKKKQGK